jgi:PAS fold
MGLMQWPFCVVILDTELRIVWANEATGHLGGVPAKGWPGAG